MAAEKVLSDVVASEVMKPLGPAMVPSDVAEQALREMQEGDHPFLPVVARETEKLLGIVLRKALVNGCKRMGHDASECRIQRHVKSTESIDFCRDDEALDGSWLEPDRSSVLVVVDERHRPVGYVERDVLR